MWEVTLLNTCGLCRREEEVWGCVATRWPHFTLHAESSRRGRWRQVRALTHLWLASTRSGKSSDTSRFWQTGHTQLFNRKSLWLWLSRGKHNFFKVYITVKTNQTLLYLYRKWLAKNWPTYLCLTRNYHVCLLDILCKIKLLSEHFKIIWIQTLVMNLTF